MRVLMLVLAIALMPLTFSFDEAVAMELSQDNRLIWDAPARPVQQWVFSCGKQVKAVINGTATSMRFGDILTKDGSYTHCRLAAQRHGKLSAPISVPNFTYRYRERKGKGGYR